MTFATIFEAITRKNFATARNEPADPPVYRLATAERNLDRTSDSFIEAVNLLDRCLPRSFGA